MLSEKTSVLIISYNRPHDVLELLQSLSTQADLSLLEETLILNNASTESYEAVEVFISQHPELKVRYEHSKENLGVSRGRNKLMQEAKGTHLLVLDDDIVFDSPTDFANIASTPLDVYYQENNTAVITFRVLYHANRQPQITAFPHKQYEAKKDEQRFLTYYFTGCCHLLRKSALGKTGLYPTDFFYGMEEYDLSYRLIQHGYTLAYDNRITVLHKESPLGRQPNYKKLASQWVNKSKVAWRYLPVRYFVSTAAMWSLQYLKKAITHPGEFFSAWWRIVKIPFTEKRSKLNKTALQYLKRVNARLGY
ncbi:MAG: glycosyltransferase family 2 protein [Chitinophagaceae bacterium]|nr:glycosyltransferase family 2 protein [Chitinophagaceae bacterium]